MAPLVLKSTYFPSEYIEAPLSYTDSFGNRLIYAYSDMQMQKALGNAFGKYSYIYKGKDKKLSISSLDDKTSKWLAPKGMDEVEMSKASIIDQSGTVVATYPLFGIEYLWFPIPTTIEDGKYTMKVDILFPQTLTVSSEMEISKSTLTEGFKMTVTSPTGSPLVYGMANLKNIETGDISFEYFDFISGNDVFMKPANGKYDADFILYTEEGKAMAFSERIQVPGSITPDLTKLVETTVKVKDEDGSINPSNAIGYSISRAGSVEASNMPIGFMGNTCSAFLQAGSYNMSAQVYDETAMTCQKLIFKQGVTIPEESKTFDAILDSDNLSTVTVAGDGQNIPYVSLNLMKKESGFMEQLYVQNNTSLKVSKDVYDLFVDYTEKIKSKFRNVCFDTTLDTTTDASTLKFGGNLSATFDVFQDEPLASTSYFGISRK